MDKDGKIDTDQQIGTDGWIDRQQIPQMDGWIDNRQTQMDGQIDTDGWIDRQQIDTDGQIICILTPKALLFTDILFIAEEPDVS